ncbi:type II toxin-antitoxin system VapC family toxin [Nitratireductor sp. ZSWI3]|uniref:type II toxin-antitoxin system VapC family toxin n=1 Tax=Nitratireductor sp. ZSWI3 TaxID=2966359 RepID=UPI0021501A25|nr:type II toxin-antitoxin system VapC family toxin [Nitratireductor sp. ZSWI3]MCR4265581.1 type II toxin-antitoxin system VapC family toxin [Nitratireductor sp. ZSWI3]
MNITADTNLLVRVVVRDDEAQARTALSILEGAEAVAVCLPCLCEFVWVLSRVYRLPRGEIATSVRMIMDRANVIADAATVAAGLRMLDAGGDFADGVIAAAGTSMGGETFVSFDRKAVARLQTTGMPALHASEFS